MHVKDETPNLLNDMNDEDLDAYSRDFQDSFNYSEYPLYFDDYK